MSFLIDTNILSEPRQGQRCEPRLKEWARAAVHGLTVVTRNVKDFADLGVRFEPVQGIALTAGREPS